MLPQMLISILLIECTASVDKLYDVTNILRLDKTEKGGFEQYGDFYVDIRGNARGLPLVQNTNPSTLDSGYENYCCRNWVRGGWEETPAPEHIRPAPPLDTTKQINGQAVAPLWQLDNPKGELKSQPKQLPKNRFCITAIVRLPSNSTLTIRIQRTDTTKSSLISTLRNRDFGYDWVLRRFEPRTPKDFQNRLSILVLTAEKPDNVMDPFYVQWAGFCEPASQEQKLVISGKFTSENVTEQVRSVMTDSVKKECKNVGQLKQTGEVCQCSPGFLGELCEISCGPNKYGLECGGECSDRKEGRDCAGFKACNGGACVCMTGWEGEMCDRKCRPGWYGSGCEHKCGTCKGGDACDRHTGQCDDGCEDGFQPPSCQNECGRRTSRDSLKDGTVADPLDFPWNAALYDKKRGGSDPHFICSATLVSPSLLITAAHCVYDRMASHVEDADRYIVVFGRQGYALNETDIYETKTQCQKIQSIHVPPSYRDNARSYADDIAVLELKEKVDPSDVTRPACFDWTGRFQPDLEEVGNGEVVGWGVDENGKTVDKMLLARPAFLSLSDCFETVGKSFLQFLTQDKFCGENTGRQAVRRGYSGGGLLFNSFLVGVTSIASPDDHKTVAYTNVSYHTNWLNKVRVASLLR